MVHLVCKYKHKMLITFFNSVHFNSYLPLDPMLLLVVLVFLLGSGDRRGERGVFWEFRPKSILNVGNIFDDLLRFLLGLSMTAQCRGFSPTSYLDLFKLTRV